ncbi:MAG TPA: sigma-70 family RNA polymerase sigma factor, partial [Chryseolinea sp.]
MKLFIKKTRQEELLLLTDLQAGGAQRRLAEKNLYERFMYLVAHGMRHYRISEDDSVSAYSDTILSVINNVVGGRFEGRSSLKSYIFQIFMNKCVDAVRKKTTNRHTLYDNDLIEHLTRTLPDKARNIVQQLIKLNEQTLLMDHIKALGEKCRQVLLLFEDGYTDKEIAIQMEYNTPEVVKTTRLRCLEKLR